MGLMFQVQHVMFQVPSLTEFLGTSTNKMPETWLEPRYKATATAGSKHGRPLSLTSTSSTSEVPLLLWVRFTPPRRCHPHMNHLPDPETFGMTSIPSSWKDPQVSPMKQVSPHESKKRIFGDHFWEPRGEAIRRSAKLSMTPDSPGFRNCRWQSLGDG